MIVLAILLGSLLAHELAHILAAKLLGWRFAGPRLMLRYAGFGVAFEPRDKRDTWKVALAGPAASAILAIIFWIELPGPVAMFGFITNGLMLAVNLLPFSMADGGVAWRSWHESR